MERKKQSKKIIWEYNDRKQEITHLLEFPDTFCFTTGNYYQLPLDINVNRYLSRIQKNLKQWLYGYLIENNIPLLYSINIEGVATVRNTKSYYDIKAILPVTDDNKDLCQTITEKWHNI